LVAGVISNGSDRYYVLSLLSHSRS